MNSRDALPMRVARWSLLLAAVLHFGAAAAGPLWHLAAFPSAGAAVATAPSGQDAEAPAGQHDELTCIVCQSATSTGVLPAPSVLLIGPVVASRDPVAAPSLLPRGTRSGERARAPPVA